MQLWENKFKEWVVNACTQNWWYDWIFISLDSDKHLGFQTGSQSSFPDMHLKLNLDLFKPSVDNIEISLARCTVPAVAPAVADKRREIDVRQAAWRKIKVVTSTAWGLQIITHWPHFVG